MARPNFIELPAHDLARAKTFYTEIFGLELTEFGPSYASTMTGDLDIGLQGDAAAATKGPLVVFAVDDLEATLAAVQEAGGRIAQPIFSFPGGRRFHFLDPNGNELAAWRAD